MHLGVKMKSPQITSIVFWYKMGLFSWVTFTLPGVNHGPPWLCLPASLNSPTWRSNCGFVAHKATSHFLLSWRAVVKARSSLLSEFRLIILNSGNANQIKLSSAVIQPSSFLIPLLSPQLLNGCLSLGKSCVLVLHNIQVVPCDPIGSSATMLQELVWKCWQAGGGAIGIFTSETWLCVLQIHQSPDFQHTHWERMKRRVAFSQPHVYWFSEW